MVMVKYINGERPTSGYIFVIIQNVKEEAGSIWENSNIKVEKMIGENGIEKD